MKTIRSAPLGSAVDWLRRPILGPFLVFLAAALAHGGELPALSSARDLKPAVGPHTVANFERSLVAPTHGNGAWVAVRGDSVLRSPDGIRWVLSATVTGAKLRGVAFDGQVP
jgi:hypothetical protein